MGDAAAEIAAGGPAAGARLPGRHVQPAGDRPTAREDRGGGPPEPVRGPQETGRLPQGNRHHDTPGGGPMNAPVPHADESWEKLFGTVFDLAGQIASRIGPDEVEARLRRTLQEAGSSVPALVTRAAAGDQDAWDHIVERYAPLVYATCVRYRLSQHDIEDVGQRVWLLLVEQIGTVREPAALPRWLAITTAREC